LYLQAILEQTGALVKRYLQDNGVLLTLDVPADLPVIMGSPQQLGQVFMNLINNAVEAMVANSDSMGKAITIQAVLEGSHIVVRIQDTGTGIPDADIPKLFDAFFTRKKKMGMGVGLSICHRIVEDHNGTITVGNRMPHGAEFTIRLPVGAGKSDPV
jgi:signal transduction histidine kinase